MPKLVRGDAQHSAVGAAESGDGCGVGESLAQSVGRELAASLDEEEVGRLAVAGMGQGALGVALSGPTVQRDQGGLIEGDGAFGAELAQRDLQPAPVAGEVDCAVQLEVCLLYTSPSPRDS